MVNIYIIYIYIEIIFTYQDRYHQRNRPRCGARGAISRRRANRYPRSCSWCRLVYRARVQAHLYVYIIFVVSSQFDDAKKKKKYSGTMCRSSCARAQSTAAALDEYIYMRRSFLAALYICLTSGSGRWTDVRRVYIYTRCDGGDSAWKRAGGTGAKPQL